MTNEQIEKRAIALVQCPRCGAEPRKQCHYVSHGGLMKHRKVKTHESRLDEARGLTTQGLYNV